MSDGPVPFYKSLYVLNAMLYLVTIVYVQMA